MMPSRSVPAAVRHSATRAKRPALSSTASPGPKFPSSSDGEQDADVARQRPRRGRREREERARRELLERSDLMRPEERHPVGLIELADRDPAVVCGGLDSDYVAPSDGAGVVEVQRVHL